MKLNKLNLKGKGELLNEFELKEIKGGYYTTNTCKGTTCGGGCNQGDTCRYSMTTTLPWACYCIKLS